MRNRCHGPDGRAVIIAGREGTAGDKVHAYGAALLGWVLAWLMLAHTPSSGGWLRIPGALGLGNRAGLTQRFFSSAGIPGFEHG